MNIIGKSQIPEDLNNIYSKLMLLGFYIAICAKDFWECSTYNQIRAFNKKFKETEYNADGIFLIASSLGLDISKKDILPQMPNPIKPASHIAQYLLNKSLMDKIISNFGKSGLVVFDTAVLITTAKTLNSLIIHVMDHKSIPIKKNRLYGQFKLAQGVIKIILDIIRDQYGQLEILLNAEIANSISHLINQTNKSEYSINDYKAIDTMTS